MVQSSLTGLREEHALDEAAARRTVGAEAALAPQHPVAQRSLGGVVGGFNAFLTHEGPQGRFDSAQVGAGPGGLLVGQQLALPQPETEPVLQRQACWSHLERTFEKFVDRGGDAAWVGQQLLEFSALEGGGVLSDEERLVLLDLCPERRAAWDKLLAKVRDDNTNNAEFQALHCALLLPGLLKKRRGATEAERKSIEKEADSVLYYLAQRFDLSPITQRGPAVGESWFAVGRTFGEHRANEVLRNYVEAACGS